MSDKQDDVVSLPIFYDRVCYAHLPVSICRRDNRGKPADLNNSGNGIAVHTVITVAYKMSGTKLEFGAAFTSPDDQFNRKRGRTIALGRLMKRRTSNFPKKLPTTHSEVLEIISTIIERTANARNKGLVRGMPRNWWDIEFENPNL